MYYLEFCIGRNVALPRGQYLAGLHGYGNLCWFILLSGTGCLQGPLQHSEFTKWDDWKCQWITFPRYYRSSWFYHFISCINCHLPMGRRERVMRKRANPLAHVCCIPCWRIEKQMLVLDSGREHWFLLWYRDLFKKKNQPSGPWLYAGLQNHPPANRKSVWQWIKCPVNGDRWRQLER